MEDTVEKWGGNKPTALACFANWKYLDQKFRPLDGCYTGIQRKALNVNWKAHMTNKELYGDLSKITSQIRKRCLYTICWALQKK